MTLAGSSPGSSGSSTCCSEGPGATSRSGWCLTLARRAWPCSHRAGTALAVQRLARRPGWHRLGVRFGPETELAVNGDELAHGRGRGGPLVEIRLANQTHRQRRAAPRGWLSSSTTSAWSAWPSRSAAWRSRLRSTTSGSSTATRSSAGSSRPTPTPWACWSTPGTSRSPGPRSPRSGSAGRSSPRRAVEGLLVRLEWRSSPGNDSRDLDQVEGALLSVTDAAFTLATPYSGDLTIPRDRLRRLKVLGNARRIVLDPSSHHLGNESPRNR